MNMSTGSNHIYKEYIEHVFSYTVTFTSRKGKSHPYGQHDVIFDPKSDASLRLQRNQEAWVKRIKIN
jgi:hypothetical protein